MNENVPAGWQLVPINPTDKMYLACDDRAYFGDIDRDWYAMLTAAPTPPSTTDAVIAQLTAERDGAIFAAEQHLRTVEQQAAIIQGHQRATPPAAPTCVCADSTTAGVTHRTDGPCYAAAPTLTDADVWRLRDAIKPGDGWDGDNWDLALAYAIAAHLAQKG